MCEGNGVCDGFGSGCSDGSADAMGVGDAVRPGPPIRVNTLQLHSWAINVARMKIRNILILYLRFGLSIAEVREGRKCNGRALVARISS